MSHRPHLLPTLLLVSQAFCGVKVGEPAPAIALDVLLPDQPVANATLSALSGKAVVLEFWATWCGPCYFAIPHLNQLVKQFEGKPIQFLSITDEEEPLVRRFLEKRPISGWVGLDRKGALHQAYGFGGVPVTVLIDAAGKVAAITHPAKLEASHLENLLAGRPVKFPPPESVTDMSLSRNGEEIGAAPLAEILIRPSTTKDMAMGVNQTKYQVKGVTVRWLVAAAYNRPQDRVIGDAIDDPTRYDVSLVVPGAKGESLHGLLPGIVCTAFGIKVTGETRDAEVLVLKSSHGKPEALRSTSTPGKSLWASQNGEVHIVDYPVSVLASILEGQIHKIVIDETGIQGKYDFDFKIDPKDPNSVLDVIRGCGFSIETNTRPLEFLVVSKVQ